MNPLQLYEKIQEQVKADAKQAALEVYKSIGTQYGVAQNPSGVHTGTDSSQVAGVNIISNDKHFSGMVVDSVGTTTTTIIGLNVANMQRIVFFGFVANNASGPATKRAIINGEAQFGRCYLMTGAGVGGIITVNTPVPGIPFFAICNFMYVDSTNLANNRVGIDGQGSTDTAVLAAATDETGAQIVRLIITGFTYNSITFTTTLAASWKLQGNIIVT